MTDNSLINSVTEKLGINKLALAGLLGVHNSVFTRINAGTRPLPVKATAALANTYAIVANLPAPSLPQPTETEIANHQQQAAWCEVQLQPLQKQLAQMQETYQQGANLLAFLHEYAITSPPATPKQQRWLEGQTYQAQQKMQKNGWQAQQQVLLKMALLQAEVAFYHSQIQVVL
jgi:hypothetical protein